MNRRDTRLLAVAGVLLALLGLVLVGLTRSSSSEPSEPSGESSRAASTGLGQPGAESGQGRSLAEAMAADHAPVPGAEPGAETEPAADEVVVATGIPRERLATPEPGSRTEADGTVVLANGCLLHYGDPGQCLPSVPRSAAEMGMTREQMPWQCEEVRLTFPDGLLVAPSDDTLALDTDGDGTACGPGDESGLMGAHAP